MSDIKETINQLEKLKKHCVAMQEIDGCTYYTGYASAIDTAVAIIRKNIANNFCPCCSANMEEKKND